MKTLLIFLLERLLVCLKTPSKSDKPVSIAWHVQHSFWAKKSDRAHIKFLIAADQDDAKGMYLALKQTEMYRRRMNDVVPLEVRRKWEEQDDKETCEAIGESL